MKLDIDKIIENLNEANADYVEYKVDFCKNGDIYSIKLKIEKKDEQ